MARGPTAREPRSVVVSSGTVTVESPKPWGLICEALTLRAFCTTWPACNGHGRARGVPYTWHLQEATKHIVGRCAIGFPQYFCYQLAS